MSLRRVRRRWRMTGIVGCLAGGSVALLGAGVGAQSPAVPQAPPAFGRPYPSAPYPGRFAPGMQPGGLFQPGGTTGMIAPGTPIGQAPSAQVAQIQGGVFPGRGYFSLAPGGSSQVLAFCTDLLSAPPSGETRFASDPEAAVSVAGNAPLSLSDALRNGLVALRGRDDVPNPFVNTGLALRLELVNVSRTPLTVAVHPGTAVVPVGQSRQPLPSQSEQLFQLAAERRWTYTNVVQFAVWALRGSTAEEVEQTYLHTISKPELARVEQLLQGCGVAQNFDRERGKYERMYAERVARLGPGATEIEGVGMFANGRKVTVAGRRTAGDTGVVRLRPASGGEFFCAAQFEDGADGKTRIRLEHLVTGRPLHAHRGYVVLKPERVASAASARG